MKRAEVGYEIIRGHQGKGYAREALDEVIGFAFAELELEQILAITQKDNAPSVALLTHSGFQYEGAMLDLDPNCGETEDIFLVASVAFFV